RWAVASYSNSMLEWLETSISSSYDSISILIPMRDQEYNFGSRHSAIYAMSFQAMGGRYGKDHKSPSLHVRRGASDKTEGHSGSQDGSEIAGHLERYGGSARGGRNCSSYRGVGS